ncbi:MAG: hypothetical protein N2203_04670 [Bacteroidia bacterium]|nr:hypothetical protein [Bacteroidia bacterium]
MLLFYRLILVCIIFTQLVIAQKKIEILHADVLKYNKQIDVNRLIGNVVCKHENTLFYCDSMYLFPNQSLKAYGNIKIVSDSIHITAEYLYYDALTKVASLEKNVVCSDNQIVLKTQTLQYTTHTHIAYYSNYAEIKRQDNQLVSEKGYYYSDSKTMAFKNNVVLTNPHYKIKTDTLFYYVYTDIAHFNAPTIILMDKDYLYCEKGWYDIKNKKAYFSKNPILFSDKKKLYADSLYYNETTSEGWAFNNIRLIDSTYTHTIKGHFGKYHLDTEKAMVTQHPVMIKIQNNQDTIFLTCDTIFYEKKDSAVIARCMYHSKIFHDKFQAIAQHIIYYQKDSSIHLINSPKFWFDKNQIVSQKSTIYLKNQSVDKIVLDSNVIIVQEADTLFHNKYHQIAGKRMDIFFKNDTIRSIHVNGNAQVYYFLQNDKHQWVGLNKAKCSKIRVDFLNNEINKIVFIDNPESILIPIKKIQFEKERLPNFQWNPNLRPQRKNIP